MQRLLVRLSAVGAILAAGGVAIVQAQFRTPRSDVAAAQQPAAAAQPGTPVPQPIPGTPDEDDAPLVPPSPDLFRGRFSAAEPSVSDSSEPNPVAADEGARFIRPVAGEDPAATESQSPADPQYPAQPPAGGGAFAGGGTFAGGYGTQYEAERNGGEATLADDELQQPGGVQDGAQVPAGTYEPPQPPAAAYGIGFSANQDSGPAYAPPAEMPAQATLSPRFAERSSDSSYQPEQPEPTGQAGQAVAIDRSAATGIPAESPAPPYGTASTYSSAPAAGLPPAQPPAATSGLPPTYGSAPAYGSAPVQPAPPAYGSAPAYSSAPNYSQPVQTPAPSALASEGRGQPGQPQQEGVQTPTLAVEKLAPPEVQVNRPATFQIRIRNLGQVAAHDVVVRDQVPQGTRLVQATPPATESAAGVLTWQLGTLEPSRETTITLELLPLREGEIGSVAQVTFQAEASVRTTSTQPKLKLKQSTQPQVLIGDRVVLSIAIVNEGSGAATGVVIEEDVPEGLSHSAGRELEYEVGTLRPGETRNLELTLRAEQPGTIRNRLVVRADGDVLVEDVAEITVVAPQLKIAIDGPARRYLDRQATYTIMVSNPGTATAQDVELTAHLPRGFQFVSTNNHGRYDPQSHAVLWSLAELPATAQGSVELTLLPQEMGERKLTIEGRAAMNLTDRRDHTIVVEGLAALFFQVGDTEDPIPVESETVYEVRVSNTGSKDATNVRLTALLPAGMMPLSGEGPTRVLVEGQQILAEPLPRLAPRGEAVYRLRARGLQPGDQRIRVQLGSDELESPVLKEESTRVYSDR